MEVSCSAKSEWQKKLLRTQFLVNLAGILERADEALLPGVYRELGLSLHASPTRLGTLTLLRSIVQVLCFPLAAYMSVHHNRSSVIALGAVLWSIATVFVGASSTFLEVAISRALNGVGLAMVIPAIQSLVADTSCPHKRGLAFGWLQFTGNLGGIFGSVFSILLAGTTVFGLAGWRASFFIIAAASLMVAFFVQRFAIDSRFQKDSKERNGFDIAIISSSALKETFIEARTVVKIPTFMAIVAQGVAGTFPWAALSFAPMWLELIGFSHKITATIMGSFIVSVALGGLFGGWLGDIFARHFPNTGRIILAQFSSGIGIPFGAVLFLFLPYDSSAAFLHGAVFFMMGLLKSWGATATNNPIFAEIVPEKLRTSIYAIDRSCESVLASFAPPLVGALAENSFGYISSASHASDFANVVVDKQNAAALAKALYVAFGIPYVFCCLLYSILYWTYPKDRDKAQLEAQLQANQSVLPGIIEMKQGYASLSEESEDLTIQLGKISISDHLDFSGEREPMLSGMT